MWREVYRVWSCGGRSIGCGVVEGGYRWGCGGRSIG